MSPSDPTTAVELDATDPLAMYRDRFVITDPEQIYLDGNSLGRLPKAAVTAARLTVEEQWGHGLVGHWEQWIDLPERYGAAIGRVIGAAPDSVIAGDSTSVNLYKLASAAMRSLPNRTDIVTDADNFPTDRYILESVAAQAGGSVRVAVGHPVDGVTVDDLAPLLGPEVGLVSLSLVSYLSAAWADLEAISELARSHGSLTLWDLSHAAGAVPVDLDGSGADLAVGCTYKYLNGGPGSPAYMYIRPALHGGLQQPIAGWFGHVRPFDFSPEYEPHPGVRRFTVGTPPIISMAAGMPGVEMIEDAGMPAIREKSIKATSLLTGLVEGRLRRFGATLASPSEADRRGSHVGIRHPDGKQLSAWLRTERKVVTDFRPPDLVRLGVAPLYNTFAQLERAVAHIEDGLASGAYRGVTPHTVT